MFSTYNVVNLDAIHKIIDKLNDLSINIKCLGVN